MNKMNYATITTTNKVRLCFIFSFFLNLGQVQLKCQFMSRRLCLSLSLSWWRWVRMLFTVITYSTSKRWVWHHCDKYFSTKCLFSLIYIFFFIAFFFSRDNNPACMQCATCKKEENCDHDHILTGIFVFHLRHWCTAYFLYFNTNSTHASL